MVAEGVPQPPWALTFLSESKSESEPREIGGKQRKRKRAGAKMIKSGGRRSRVGDMYVAFVNFFDECWW